MRCSRHTGWWTLGVEYSAIDGCSGNRKARVGEQELEGGHRILANFVAPVNGYVGDLDSS